MIERDYFMRMINILTKMIARTLFLKNKMEFPKALLDIQSTGKTLLGIDGDLTRRLSPAQIMQLFGSDLTVAVPKSYVAAILFKEEADVRARMGEEDESTLLYVRALALLLDVLEWANEAVEPNHLPVIDEVLEKLKGYALSVELLDKLLGFHERMGRYDKAENVLYDILEVNPEYTAEGMLFYKRLLEKKDTELEKGGLPREEVVQGMEQIANR